MVYWYLVTLKLFQEIFCDFVRKKFPNDFATLKRGGGGGVVGRGEGKGQKEREGKSKNWCYTVSSR